MEAVLEKQNSLLEEVKRMFRNIKKDTSSRKTPEYRQVRLAKLNDIWVEFESNHEILLTSDEKDHQYFDENIFEFMFDLYKKVQELLAVPAIKLLPPTPTGQTIKAVTFDKSGTSDVETESDASEIGATVTLLKTQRSQFRALSRIIEGIKLDSLNEKWEIEDEIKNLQARWKCIEKLHLDIDTILEGTSVPYNNQFLEYETRFKEMKKTLNKKLCIKATQQLATPHIDIPTFSGSYVHWPTFLDVFTETIHNNPGMSKTQKMQYLKGKLRGEPERLVQHLYVTADNYDTCWDILTHRYNNKQKLFSDQFKHFMTQPSIKSQTASELKRLYDVTMESVHVIHNLGIDTTTWDPMLVHILCEKLDEQTYSDYMEFRKAPKELPSFDELMNFLEGKFTALEPVTKKKIEPNSNNYQQQKATTHSNRISPYNNTNRRLNYNNTYNVTSKRNACVFCNNNHALYQCADFTNASPDFQLKTIAKYNYCKNCLFEHTQNYCRSEKRCRECNQPHHTLIHDAITKANKSQQPFALKQSHQKLANFTSNSDDEILLATALVQVLSADGTYVMLRALLDQGSQITLITEDAAQRLGLKREQFHSCVGGVGTLSNKSRGKIRLQCKSTDNEFEFTTDALILSRLVTNLPNATFPKRSWPHIKFATLADPDYNISRPIDILLDADVYSQILMNGLLKGQNLEPVAQQTRLGWILSGAVKTYNCHVIVNNYSDLSKYWELEDITEQIELTEEETYCENHYKTHTRRLTDGKYVVAIPMKINYHEKLGKSKPQALAQFSQLEKKLTNNKCLSESYKAFIQEYLTLKHMKESTYSNSYDLQCFLPHHDIHKQDSTTTKLRVVFNASAKTSSGYSLNDLMESGPKLQTDLQDVLLRWRSYKYVFVADCEKMYRMILIREEDQHLQKIIWRDTPTKPLKEFQLCTVTYGTKSAPYLALRTLQQLTEDEGCNYPLAAKVLQQDRYVDDVLSGSNSLEQAKSIQLQLIEILLTAGFNLRKWSSNAPSLLSHLPEHQLNSTMEFMNDEATKTLGLQWTPQTDKFLFKLKIDTKNDIKLTKRKLLSEISKIFDPLGWLSPVTIKAKLLFQQGWAATQEWDDPLPTAIVQDWTQFQNDIIHITDIEIPRWIGDLTTSCELHGFCDASEKVYACAIYMKTLNNDNTYNVQLLVAKSRLAPISKKMTLPRLELCGAVLLSNLTKKVRHALGDQNMKIQAWTDSMITLGWIKGDSSRWKAFVANRVKQITEIIPPNSWKHVRSEENSADCATRGLSIAQIKKHQLWWDGPQWLKSCTEIEPITIPITYDEFKNRNACTSTLQASPLVLELLHKHSNLTHITRVVAWLLRLRYKQTISKTAYLTSYELMNALYTIVRQIQIYDFNIEYNLLKENKNISGKSPILTLNPFLDDNNILRARGRLRNSMLTDTEKTPMILASNSRLTELLILQAHTQTLHGGPRLTLARLREKFWILGGFRAVKKQIHRCVTCRRFSNQKQAQLMGDLPKPRVTPSRPFSHTGVDYTGHVELKATKGRGMKTLKGYIAVFVCLATKAIHLELVTDLSSIAFLSAFKRFCARRGKPTNMYSDNGTNFVGANKLLKLQYKECLATIDNNFLKYISEMGIIWHFNAPAWPSAGGLWEAAVKSMKYHLKRVIGEQRFTYEEFSTLLCQVEACLNSRPLSPLTESLDNIDCLTPGHFLVGSPLLATAEPDRQVLDLRKRWQLVQKAGKDFWKMWSREYLQQLQSRQKWKTPGRKIQVDDIVCIKEENAPPGKWPLGRITELHPGKDGYTRGITLKTENGYLKRPIIKLAPLLSSENDNIPEKPQKRQNRPLTLTNLLCYTLILFMTFMTPVATASVQDFKITPINPNKSLYFDQLSELQPIRDEWKLIVYYNMSSYWQSMKEVQVYIDHISDLSQEKKTGILFSRQAKMTVHQLNHDMNELRHYNRLLKSQHQLRSKRGLINGVGYVANALFGVLDERFAEKYENDIDKIQHNSEHLLTLIKNQTSIIEAENNIVKRNEAIMNTQFRLINEQINSMTSEINKVTVQCESMAYFLSASTATDRIIANLKNIQQTILDTLTNMYQGHIDVHLLPPEQLEEEVINIASHLQDDLTLPDVKDNIRSLYKLLRIKARLTTSFLIMEIKIPLLTSDKYELDKIIPLPQKFDNKTILTTTSTDYIASNFKRSTIIFLNEEDVRRCMTLNDKNLLCKIEHPEYNMKISDSICNIPILTHNNDKGTYCTSKLGICNNKWVKLHKPDTWLFTCCQECHIHIMCPAGLTAKSLRGNGMITLGQGCVVKGDPFMIFAHNDLTNQVTIQNYKETPELSPLNDIINTNLSQLKWLPEEHTNEFTKIKTDLKVLQDQSQLQSLTTHDLYQYVMIYVVIACGAIALVVAAYCRLTRNCRHRRSGARQRLQDIELSVPKVLQGHVSSAYSGSVTSVDRATSPVMTNKTVRFNKEIDD